MTEVQPQSATGHAGDSPATDALAHLARMSGTGSAFGQAEYAAINPASIVSVILGFASVFSLLLSFMLFIPLTGVVFGLIGLRQIRHSNGTQTGRGFALGGIALSLLIGGLVVGLQAAQYRSALAQSEEAAQAIADFGQQIKAEHYEHAYQDMTTRVFRGHVTLEAFTNTYRELQANAAIGRLQSMEWNGQRMEFQPSGEGRTVAAMAVVKFDKLPEAGREEMRLSDAEGKWKVDAIPRLFPEQKLKRGMR